MGNVKRVFFSDFFFKVYFVLLSFAFFLSTESTTKNTPSCLKHTKDMWFLKKISFILFLLYCATSRHMIFLLYFSFLFAIQYDFYLLFLPVLFILFFGHNHSSTFIIENRKEIKSLYFFRSIQSSLCERTAVT